MKELSLNKSFGGFQGVHCHESKVCGCDMTFSVYIPPQAEGGRCPVLWYLSGLTCTHANVTDKGEFRRFAAEYGLVVVCPDTSPRGDHVADEKDNWQLGQGAGFYVDATESPYDRHYKMYTYITEELQDLVVKEFPVDRDRQGLCGHSMGGHGALVMALRNGDRYKSCSAFAPIVSPSTADWSRPALRAYLGEDESKWREWDACSLIEDGKRFPALLVDQGDADSFLREGLRPHLLEAACEKSGIPLHLRMQPGYDHSYYFIASFIEDHMAWHGGLLSGL
jgi:S-formylglutathione hydrolase